MLTARHSPRRQPTTPDERRGEAGYTLVELMVVAALLIVVLGAILGLAEATQRIAPKESERANVIREAQVGLHRMTRELRHAYQSLTVTASQAQADVLTASGTPKTVRYKCDDAHPTEPGYTQCRRYVFSGGSWSAGVVVIDRVLNGGAVFFATPPDYVRAVVEVAARGDLNDGYDHRVVLEDGIYMRNLDD